MQRALVLKGKVYFVKCASGYLKFTTKSKILEVNVGYTELDDVFPPKGWKELAGREYLNNKKTLLYPIEKNPIVTNALTHAKKVAFSKG